MLLAVSIMYFVTLSFSYRILPEDLNSIQTIDDVWPLYDTFYPIKNDTIRFSVHVSHDAWIALTGVAYPTAPKYEVLLGGNRDSVVKILESRNILAEEDKGVLNPSAYQGFWIKLENRHQPNLKISVGFEGKQQPFIKTTLMGAKHIDINYFALATTGLDVYIWKASSKFVPKPVGNWLLKDIDINSRLIVYPTLIEVTTYSSDSSVRIYENFYKITENVFRFFVKGDHGSASLIFLNKKKDQRYEIVFDSSEMLIIRNNKTINEFRGNFIDDENYIGYWIDMNSPLQPDGSVKMVMNIGLLGTQVPIVKHIDNNLPLEPKTFSVATNRYCCTRDTKYKGGQWKLYL